MKSTITGLLYMAAGFTCGAVAVRPQLGWLKGLIIMGVAIAMMLIAGKLLQEIKQDAAAPQP